VNCSSEVNGDKAGGSADQVGCDWLFAFKPWIVVVGTS